MVKFKKLITAVKLLVIIFSMNTLSGEEIVWEEKFDNNGSLESLGWKRERKSNKDEFKVENGKLKALCAYSPHKGSLYSRPVPFIKRGYIIFDARSNGRGYDQLSLQFFFYNILTSFSGSAKAVASSSTRMGAFFSIALAIDKRCASPPERYVPPSPIFVS